MKHEIPFTSDHVSANSSVDVDWDIKLSERPAHILVRRVFMDASLKPGSKILEIGASFMPTYPKRDSWNTRVVDHTDRESLVAKYSADANVTPEWLSAIEDVDFIADDGSGFESAVRTQDPLCEFDAIVAAHVIEHVPCVVGFLTQASNLLAEEGALLLAVPQRHLHFDFFRPLSTFGDVVLASVSPTAYQLKSQIDAHAMRAQLGGSDAWSDNDLVLDGLSPKIVTPFLEGILTGMKLRKEFMTSGLESFFGHRWVFDSESFCGLVEQIVEAYDIPLRVVEVEQGLGSEFLVAMSKSSTKNSRKEYRSSVKAAVDNLQHAHMARPLEGLFIEYAASNRSQLHLREVLNLRLAEQEARVRKDMAEAALARLRKRRIVRMALAFARLMRPVFLLVARPR